MSAKLTWFDKLLRTLKRWLGLNDPDARKFAPCGGLGADDCDDGDRRGGVFAI